MSTTRTDRELLELAAKAAGLRGVVSDLNPSGELAFRVLPGDGSFYYWRPHMDDGDALRLAVKLGVGMLHDKFYVSVYGPTGAEPLAVEKREGGLGAATRRAIVRAAAAIGEAMP